VSRAGRTAWPASSPTGATACTWWESPPPNVVQEVGETPYPTTTLHATRPPSLRPPRRLRDRLNVGARLRRARWEATRRAHAAVLSDLLQTAAPGGVVIVTQVWAMEWVAMADTAGLHVWG